MVVISVDKFCLVSSKIFAGVCIGHHGPGDVVGVQVSAPRVRGAAGEPQRDTGGLRAAAEGQRRPQEPRPLRLLRSSFVAPLRPEVEVQKVSGAGLKLSAEKV